MQAAHSRLTMLAISLVVLTLSSTAGAATLYVGTGEAYTTIQAAVTAASAYDTIVVRDGTYVENVILDDYVNPGDETSGLHFRTGVTLESEHGATLTTLQADAAQPHALLIEADGVRVTGLTITNAYTPDTYRVGILLLGADGCTLADNVLTNNGRGIALNNSSYCALIDNICSSNPQVGFWIVGGSNHNTIRGNTISLNGTEQDAGVFLLSADYNLFVDNDIVDNRGWGFNVQTSDGNTIRANTISDNDLPGVYLSSSNGNTVTGNTIADNLTGAQLRQSEFNAVYLNDFIGTSTLYSNTDDDSATSTWSSPADLEYEYNTGSYLGRLGNYWIDYGGVDTNGDGVGETAYELNTLGDPQQDQFPLISQIADYALVVPATITNVSTGETFVTLQEAIDDADTLDGHLIQVTPGEYTENVDVTKELTIESTGFAGDTYVTATSSSDHVFEVTAANVTLRGFHLSGAGDSDYAGVYLGPTAENCTVSDCTVSECDYGFLADAALNNVVENLKLAGYRDTTVSFTFAGSLGVKSVNSAPPNPPEAVAMGRYVNVVERAVGSQISLKLYYLKSDPGQFDESTLSVWRYDAGTWSVPTDTGVNETENYVYVNDLAEFGVLGALGTQQYDVTWINNLEERWSCGTCWSSAHFPSNTATEHYNVFIDSDMVGDVFVKLENDLSVTVDNLTVDEGDYLLIGGVTRGTLTLNGGPTSGTITNNGTIEIHTDWLTSYLWVNGEVSLGGIGELVIHPATANYIRGVTSYSRLTNEADHTIRGSRRICDDNMIFTNHGMVDADNPAFALEVNPTDGGDCANDGVMQSSNGATLWIYTGNWDNTGGVIQALDGSLTQIAGAAVSGGELTTSGSGIVELRENGLAADLANTGTLRVPNGGGTGYLQGTITNNGLLEVASQHYGTILALNGDVLLDGTGELLIGDNEHNSVRGASVTDRLTNSATHTIHGAYYLGFNQIVLTNHGLIDADNSLGHPLVVDPTDGETNYNDATMQASGGGLLQLTIGTWDNTGGVIQALDGSVVQITGAGVLGGELTTSGTGLIQLRDGGLLADLTNTGQIQVPNGGGTGYLQGTILNDGTLKVASAGSGTILYVYQDTTLEGTGDLLIGDDEHNSVRGASATDRLINGATHTVHGACYLGFNQMVLTNHGLIDADRPGLTLSVDSTDGETSYNDAIMQSSNGATLWISTGTWDNTGGIIQALDGSVTQIASAGVSGGELTTSGSGLIQLRDGGLLADLTNTGRIQVPNGGGSGYLEGTILNEGTLEVASTGSSTVLYAYGDVTLEGSGDLLIGDDAHNSVRGAVNTDRLTNGPAHTIHGAYYLGYNLMLLGNHGLIDADRPGLTLVIDPTDSGVCYNDATMQASGGGILQLTTGSWDNTGGVIQALDASTVQITGSACVSGGSLNTIDSGIIELSGNARVADLVNDGYLQIPNGGGTGYIQGTVTNNGTIDVEGTHFSTFLGIDSNTELAGTGVLLLGGHNDIYAAGFTLTNGTDHTIRAQGYDNAIYPDLTNYGTIEAPTGTILILAAAYSPQPGSRTVADGTLNATGTTDMAGTLSGNGTFNGSVALTDDGVVAPGTSAGQLTISGAYTQAGGGTLRIELGGTTPGSEYDRLHVTGSATLDGNLEIELIDGFVPEIGAEFVILTAGSVGGCFATVSGPGEYEVACNANNVTITCVGLPYDFDADGEIDLDDFAVLVDCMAGPGVTPDPSLPDVTPQDCLDVFDASPADGDVDLHDFFSFQQALNVAQ